MVGREAEVTRAREKAELENTAVLLDKTEEGAKVASGQDTEKSLGTGQREVC